ncbi:MAG: type II toxin-antitoxin system Phd/YefM family antitoxin [Pseudomonadales bacterium]
MNNLSNEWQLQEAKNKLSQLVKKADKGIPQFITVHGKQAAVILSAQAYKKLVRPSSTLSSALLMPILNEHDKELFERNQDVGRDIEL